MAFGDTSQSRDMREWRGVIVQLVMTACLTALALKSPDPYVLHTVVGILGASVGQAITRARGEAVNGPPYNGNGGGGGGGGGNTGGSPSYGNYGMMTGLPGGLGGADMKHVAKIAEVKPSKPPTIAHPMWASLVGAVTAIGFALLVEFTLF